MTEIEDQVLRGASRAEKAALFRKNAERMTAKARDEALPMLRAKYEAAAAHWSALAEAEDFPSKEALTRPFSF